MSLFGRRERREIAELTAYVDRLRSQRDKALKDATTWHGTASRSSELFTDTSIVNDCLTRDLTALKKRVNRLRKVAARLLAAYVRERLRATQLQRRLDDAVGLTSPALDAGDSWQDRREQRMKYDKPAAEEASAS